MFLYSTKTFFGHNTTRTLTGWGPDTLRLLLKFILPEKKELHCYQWCNFAEYHTNEYLLVTLSRRKYCSGGGPFYYTHIMHCEGLSAARHSAGKTCLKNKKGPKKITYLQQQKMLLIKKYNNSISSVFYVFESVLWVLLAFFVYGVLKKIFFYAI